MRLLIKKNVTVTVDLPSNHKSKMLPVLDVEQWICDILVKGVVKKQSLHSHYMKGMSIKLLISKDSAPAMRAKMNTLCRLIKSHA